ncbi:UL49 [Colobine gammaherpesvirus 1]|uniref:UL49 n=1 Tax=Colobine gammaherpesvirus 1 TaxID=2597325 RepID=A0A5B8G8H0_9GAMA|nr:UL49 [Colobine gammaherpesvirus 1]QDQ69277.1 UL49 [Colobine gammaherpesvirus 1]
MALAKRWTDFATAWLHVDADYLTRCNIFGDLVGVPPEEYLGFLVFGESGLRGSVTPWVRCLLDRPSMRQAIVSLLDFGDDIPPKPVVLCAGQQLLCAYVWVALTLGARRPAEETNTLRCPARHVWLKYLSMSFVKACSQMTRFLGIQGQFPFVTCVPQEPLSLPWLRRRWHGDASRRQGLEVPAPSARGTTTVFSALSVGTTDVGLLAALRRVASRVPCGSPFEAMLFSLAFLALSRCPRVVVPVGEQEGDGIVRVIGKRLLAYNVLWPCVSLPVFCERLVSVALGNADSCARVVVCLECGHCLNFGRGRFRTVNFPPTNVFFSRDQKEKQFTICGTTGRIYCSYCGSEHLRVLPLCDVTGPSFAPRVRIRAVLSNNAGLAISDLNQVLSFVVPCLGSQDCESALLKHATVGSLLHLTSSPTEFVCGRCAR